ncbi:MAG: PhnB protein [Actinomycetota bacterium]|nr:PhnB protein [Actinomycetota bacterium]
MATDPMDALRQPIVPRRPSDEFAASLRRRLEGELFPTPPGGTVSTTTATRSFVPPGMHSVGTYLAVRDARAAIAWYSDVFGAVEHSPMLVGADGRVGHASIRIGDTVVMLADPYELENVGNPEELGGTSVQLQLYVEDADATFARALDRGATVLYPVADQPYGDRSGKVRDPFGHNWFIATHIENVAADEEARRFEQQGYATEPQPFRPVWDEPGKREGDVGYFTLEVPDVVRASAFYRELFGWDPAQGSLPEGRHVTNVTPPGGLLGGKDRPGIALYFRVADVQAAAARVRELGGEVLEVTEYPSGGNAVCRDDQGLEFQLFQPGSPDYA